MIFSAIVLIVAIIVASLLAAWIARGAIKRLLAQHDRELRAAAIGSIVDAATEASVWNSLTPQEQVMNDRAVGMADIQIRLLPIKGSSVAADWAAHQLAELKRTSATFGYQLEPALVEFRDRLIDWQNKPSRARKIFQGDLERWKSQNTSTEKSLLAEQDAWVAKQHHDQFATPAAPAQAPTAQPLGYVPAAPPPGAVSSPAASPSTETQRLLDDVQALEVRPAPLPHP
ncbi:hypothetical protein [Cryobacterium sp. TMB1-7]|uniref:hypothetical protein n=1 Tax=Cryobacterium sp. TMB1-7 TaxID=2555866 RepID=UPI00106D4449|nr:hypothetical protein [Cryobacterium sp. TMB1-7]TFC57333.1 hypothetical protein E3O60_14680 [Cryobacterium sp. TMB1-7]